MPRNSARRAQRAQRARRLPRAPHRVRGGNRRLRTSRAAPRLPDPVREHPPPQRSRRPRAGWIAAPCDSQASAGSRRNLLRMFRSATSWRRSPGIRSRRGRPRVLRPTRPDARRATAGSGPRAAQGCRPVRRVRRRRDNPRHGKAAWAAPCRPEPRFGRWRRGRAACRFP